YWRDILLHLPHALLARRTLRGLTLSLLALELDALGLGLGSHPFSLGLLALHAVLLEPLLCGLRHRPHLSVDRALVVPGVLELLLELLHAFVGAAGFRRAAEERTQPCSQSCRPREEAQRRHEAHAELDRRLRCELAHGGHAGLLWVDACGGQLLAHTALAHDIEKELRVRVRRGLLHR